ncbi:MAG: helix-turn-helix domain-containing protein [Flavihumibacter sp.]|nr:helix-turn-helix domain-containing protein [Flavihumibacter sp.]
MPVSKNKPVRFGLYGEEEFLLPDFLHIETMQYRSERHNWVIRPHFHSHLFQLFLIEKGKVVYTLEKEQHIVTGPAIVAIPENTLHGLNVDMAIAGMVLTISTSYLESVFNNLPKASGIFNHTQVIKNVKKNQVYTSIKELVYALYNEIKEEQPEKGLILQNYLSLLLIKLYRLCIEEGGQAIGPASRNHHYFNAFLRSIKQSYTPMKMMHEYARELNITPVHLNRICQATVGKSALQMVHEFHFLEAEKYLKHTDYSIAEIAYRLNFEDPAYFSRFFSKLAGVSPKAFRQQPQKIKRSKNFKQ